MSIAWEEHSRCSVAIDAEKKKKISTMQHFIVSLRILGIFLLGVSDRGRYTRGVFQSRVENIRRIYGVFIRTGRGRSRVSFIRRVLLEVFIEERLFGQV